MRYQQMAAARFKQIHRETLTTDSPNGTAAAIEAAPAAAGGEEQEEVDESTEAQEQRRLLREREAAARAEAMGKGGGRYVSIGVLSGGRGPVGSHQFELWTFVMQTPTPTLNPQPQPSTPTPTLNP